MWNGEFARRSHRSNGIISVASADDGIGHAFLLPGERLAARAGGAYDGNG
jgi:hypothetical protein